jgi:hypothetical protein
MAELNVSRSAYRMAISEEHPDMTKYWLKCRAGWKETQTIEHVGKDGKDLVGAMPEDELDERIRALEDVCGLSED